MLYGQRVAKFIMVQSIFILTTWNINIGKLLAKNERANTKGNPPNPHCTKRFLYFFLFKRTVEKLLMLSLLLCCCRIPKGVGLQKSNINWWIPLHVWKQFCCNFQISCCFGELYGSSWEEKIFSKQRFVKNIIKCQKIIWNTSNYSSCK